MTRVAPPTVRIVNIYVSTGPSLGPPLTNTGVIPNVSSHSTVELISLIFSLDLDDLVNIVRVRLA